MCKRFSRFIPAKFILHTQFKSILNVILVYLSSIKVISLLVLGCDFLITHLCTHGQTQTHTQTHTHAQTTVTYYGGCKTTY